MTRADLSAVAELLAAGVTVDGVAARLALPRDLVEAMVDELDRLGVVAVTPTGLPRVACTSCSPAPVCRGCPLSDGSAGGAVIGLGEPVITRQA